MSLMLPWVHGWGVLRYLSISPTTKRATRRSFLLLLEALDDLRPPLLPVGWEHAQDGEQAVAVA